MIQDKALEQEPTRSQKLRDAGYTVRTKGWDKEVDEQEPVTTICETLTEETV
jgi:hypothetical protein